MSFFLLVNCSPLIFKSKIMQEAKRLFPELDIRKEASFLDLQTQSFKMSDKKLILCKNAEFLKDEDCKTLLEKLRKRKISVIFSSRYCHKISTFLWKSSFHIDGSLTLEKSISYLKHKFLLTTKESTDKLSICKNSLEYAERMLSDQQFIKIRKAVALLLRGSYLFQNIGYVDKELEVWQYWIQSLLYDILLIKHGLISKISNVDLIEDLRLCATGKSRADLVTVYKMSLEFERYDQNIDKQIFLATIFANYSNSSV